MSPTLTGNVLNWASEIDGNTLAQAQRAAAMPFVQKPLALMPDAHYGRGATIGSVIATDGAVMPAAVGVDLGCGMIAMDTGIPQERLPDDLATLHSQIARSVPAGMGKAHEIARMNAPITALLDRAPEVTDKQSKTMWRQMGTLGGGNHFVEVCVDERGIIWLTLHSGSRGIGNQLANQHITEAQGQLQRRMESLEDPELAYFIEGTKGFLAYIEAMLWSQDYAALNRETMMAAVVNQFQRFIGETFQPKRVVNVHHNYCEQEEHGGKQLWITRKGAVRARVGDWGIIPGSMATGSYIVEGLGNPDSYNSCSHGAGRTMSRGRARRELDTDTLDSAMEGIAWNHDHSLIDEDPRSYKDLGQVMEDQSDLVKIHHRLETLLNYKGTN